MSFSESLLSSSLSSSSSQRHNDQTSFNTNLTRGNLYNDAYGLPNGWNAFRDRYNRVYYVNFASGASQWENPISCIKDTSQHTDASWPISPPHIDTCTPYYLWFLGKDPIQPEQYWYENEPEQPIVQRGPEHEFTPEYWHIESQKQYAQTRDIISEQQINMLPNRSISSSYEHSSGFVQSLSWVFRTNVFLTFLTFTMIMVLPGTIIWSLHKIADIDMNPWVKYVGPLQLSIFSLAYLIYFIIYLLPTIFCCFPWLCGINCGWSQLPFFNLISLDLITPLKKRTLRTAASRSKVLDIIDQFYKDIPVLSLTSESYHYPYEDVFFDNKKVNASDYDAYSVSKATHGSISVTRNHSNDNNNNNNNEPILSHRTRRLMKLTRYRDVSVPSQTISSQLLPIQHNLYNVITVDYTSRFELHPIQIPMLDSLMKEHYYYNYVHDLHTDTHLQYTLGFSSEDVLLQSQQTQTPSAPYTDVLFIDDENSAVSNGNCLFKCCFTGNVGFFLSIFFGFYVIALAVWKNSTVHFTYNNIKYLHLEPFEQRPSDEHIVNNNDNDRKFSSVNSTASSTPLKKAATMELKSGNSDDKRVKYVLVDQVLFNGPRARTAGERPSHHQLH